MHTYTCSPLKHWDDIGFGDSFCLLFVVDRDDYEL